MELPNFGTETKPYLIYEAKKASFKHAVNKVKTPITLGEFICDLDGYSTGWAMMTEGQAPQWSVNKNRAVFGPIPSDAKDKDGKPAWKQGIRVLLYSPATFGGDGLCDFDTNGFGARTGVFELLQKFVAHPERTTGMVPVVKYVGYKDHGTGSKATTIPQFEIVKFVPRPAAMSGVATASSSTVHAPQVHMQTASNVQPTAPVTAPPQVKTSNEF